MRTGLRISSVLVGIMVAGLVFSGTTALATTVLGTEDPVNGLVVPFPPPFNDQGTVASDGETPFDPFGFGADTSDGVQFSSSGWIPDPSHAAAFAPGFWTQLPVSAENPNTWVLPAVIPGCGHENEPSCEPAGVWFLPGQTWVPGAIGTFVMLQANGSLSDILITANNGPGGTATLTFKSDPLPEPASLALIGSGLVVVGWLARRRRAV